jgi:hypothetical protein
MQITQTLTIMTDENLENKTQLLSQNFNKIGEKIMVSFRAV